jgi:hypothetical protein
MSAIQGSTRSLDKREKGLRKMRDHEYRELLESCAAHPLEGPAEKWQELFQVLALPLRYVEFVPLVLHQGRWRKAIDPVRYVRAAVRREHCKQERRKSSGPFPLSISELSLPRDEDGVPMCHDGAIEYLTSRSLEDTWETPYVEQRVRREFRGGERWDEDAQHTLNYSKLMDEVTVLAGLTKAQRDAIEEVLRLRGSSGLSRAQILATSPAERRRRQAAWKWIERNKALLAKLLSNRP